MIRNTELLEQTSLINVIRKARELVERGWVQRTMHAQNSDLDDFFCALGALAQASGMNQPTCIRGAERSARYRESRLALARTIAAKTGADSDEEPDVVVTAFNDDPSTTQADVVAMFDKTLAELGGLG